MPLIIITGLPTSGKTTRARQLQRYLRDKISSSSLLSSSSSGLTTTESESSNNKYRLHVISDESVHVSRRVYDLSVATDGHARSANAGEKDARAAVYAAVKRVLSERDVVVLDGMNYIKGWRYQLYCEAKAVRTGSCVLQVGCGVERARGVNEERMRRREQDERGREEEEDEDEEEPYDRDCWDNLAFRYEEPNPMTRWDSPLFTLVWDDDEAQTTRTFDALWEAMAGQSRKLVRPNQSTEPRSSACSGSGFGSGGGGGNYLYLLERETQHVVKLILEQQQGEGGGGGGGCVRIPLADGGSTTDGDEYATVELPALSKVTLSGLQRLRRAFVGLHRGGIGLETVKGMVAGRIRGLFVRYLNDAFETEE